MNPELSALLQELGISEEDFASMADAGVFDESADLAKRKTDFFQEQFNKPTQGDRMISGYYVPRSNMGRLADLGHKGLSAYMMSQGMGSEAGLIEGLKKGGAAYGATGARDRLGDGQDGQSKLEMLLELLRSGG